MVRIMVALLLFNRSRKGRRYPALGFSGQTLSLSLFSRAVPKRMLNTDRFPGFGVLDSPALCADGADVNEAVVRIADHGIRRTRYLVVIGDQIGYKPAAERVYYIPPCTINHF